MTPGRPRALRALTSFPAWGSAGGLLLAQLALAAPAAAGDPPEHPARAEPGEAAQGAQATGTITGTVTDDATKKPLPDVVVELISQGGEAAAITDSEGRYRLSNLTPGAYMIRIIKDEYKEAMARVDLGRGQTIRVNRSLSSAPSPEVILLPWFPPLDVHSTRTGLTLGQDVLARLPLSRPDARGGAARSFESVAELAPGARNDAYGVSFNGTTSPENRHLVDGLSVNNPAFGVNGTPLSVHFLEELQLLSGSYMPEYGRSTGGVLDAVTKSGTNEFHGSAWLDFSPGAMEGERRRVPVVDQSLRTEHRTDFIHQVGAQVGGPILKDKLFFFGGAAFSATRQKVEQAVHRRRFDPRAPLIDDRGVAHPEIGNDFLRDENGDPVTERVPGTEDIRPAVSRSVQYIGKVTFTPSTDHTLDLLVFGDQTRSGGNGEWGIDPMTSGIEGGAGDYSALSHRYVAEANDVQLRWSGDFDNKTLLFDAGIGWHHQEAARLPSDGSRIGSKQGLAGKPSVVWQRFLPVHHDVKEFRPDITADQCADAIVQDVDDDGDGAPDATVVRDPQCSARSYFSGGPDYIDEQDMDRVHGRVVVTKLFQALGQHVLKGGVDLEQTSYNHTKAYSGTVRYAENGSGSAFDETRRYGFLTGPDTPVVQDVQRASSTSTMIGAFVQDSWFLLEEVTVNLGVRYDAQLLFGDGGQLGMALPYQFSPRAGVIYDFTRQGDSKVFASFARYHEAIPLDLADRAFPGESRIAARRRAALCNPAGPACDARSLASRGRVFGTPFDPDQYYTSSGVSRVPVDPAVQPQATDEIVLGGEYALSQEARAGAVYTHTYLVDAIEDMSVDDGNTLFLGNPGSGAGRRFPKAQREYDGVNVHLAKSFSKRWLAQVSYTLSFLRGNVSGLYRPETGQLDPNITSDFDLTSLTVNRTGPLPGDRTHEIKAYAARDFRFDEFLPGPRDMAVTVGLGYTGRSGAPTSFLGAHAIYGAGESFILPRGSGDPLPWTHSVDAHVQYDVLLAKGVTASVYMDVFNLFNFQAPIAVDENYTFTEVAPIVGGKPVRGPDGKLVPDPAQLRRADGTTFFDAEDRNPNFGNPTAYQPPLTFRFGARTTF